MMEKYQIIPRKFRPARFSDVVGQETIVTTLKNAIINNRIGQAYLFCGARGCGKTSLARLFAKSLNCTKLTEGYEACNECDCCREIGEGRSLDVIEIDGASNRGIDDIRQINETVGYAPNTGSYKIYIIDEVHMLTKEAFNALLKTLEEPPKSVKFFFATTEPHKLPPTIISRCQRFNLGRIPEKALVEKLKRISSTLDIAVEDEALIQISHLSEGSLRDAESLLDQLICFGQSPITLDLTRSVFGLINQDLLLKLDDAIQTQNHEQAISLAREFYESGKDINASIDSLLEHFRTYLLIHLGQPARGVYKKWASSYTKEQCLLILDKLIDWQHSLLKTPFKQIHLEMLLLDLTRSMRKIPLETLVQRLIDLEAALKNRPEAAAYVVVDTPEKNALPSAAETKTANDLSLNTVALDDSIDESAMDEEKIKDREFDKEAAQILESIASEEPTFAAKPAPLKSDSSSSFSINPPKKEHPRKYDTLIRFAAVELEGSVK